MARCPHCQHDNESFFRFCLMCGADLSNAVAPASMDAPTEPSPAPDGADGLGPATRNEAAGRFDQTQPVEEKDLVSVATLRAQIQSRGEVETRHGAPDTRHNPAQTNESKAKFRQVTSQVTGRRSTEAPRYPEDQALRAHTPESSFAASTKAGPLPNRARSPFRLIRIKDDGSDGEEFVLYVGDNTLGKGSTDIAFREDPYLNPHHLTIRVADNTVQIQDTGTLNGTYLRITREVRLEHGDLFRVGQELLRYQELDCLEPIEALDEDDTDRLGSPMPKNAWARVVQQMSPQRVGHAYLLQKETVTLGRERGDINFAKDGYVSGRHAQLTVRDGQGYLQDLDSSNGTYVAIKNPRLVTNGDMVLVGQQLLRITQSSGA